MKITKRQLKQLIQEIMLEVAAPGSAAAAATSPKTFSQSAPRSELTDVDLAALNRRAIGAGPEQLGRQISFTTAPQAVGAGRGNWQQGVSSLTGEIINRNNRRSLAHYILVASYRLRRDGQLDQQFLNNFGRIVQQARQKVTQIERYPGESATSETLRRFNPFLQSLKTFVNQANRFIQNPVPTAVSMLVRQLRQVNQQWQGVNLGRQGERHETYQPGMVVAGEGRPMNSVPDEEVRRMEAEQNRLTRQIRRREQAIQDAQSTLRVTRSTSGGLAGSNRQQAEQRIRDQQAELERDQQALNSIRLGLQSATRSRTAAAPAAGIPATR